MLSETETSLKHENQSFFHLAFFLHPVCLHLVSILLCQASVVFKKLQLLQVVLVPLRVTTLLRQEIPCLTLPYSFTPSLLKILLKPELRSHSKHTVPLSSVLLHRCTWTYTINALHHYCMLTTHNLPLGVILC